jgi:N-acetylmuramoyl-L-alanine amidase
MLRNVKQIMSGPDISAGAAVTNEEPPRAIPEAAHSNIGTPAPALPAIATRRIGGGSPLRRAADAMALHTESTQLSLTRELGLKINRIVIDPGHGGFDTGAKGPHGLLEKDLCLDVALRLGEMIRENIPGAEVIYTRKDDSYVPLEDRTALANNADADLFISIHANSSDYREVRGVETYYLSLATSKEAKELAIRENAMTQSSLHDLPDLVQKITQNEKIAESRLLAARIQDTLSERLQLVSRWEKNRGVKQAPFIVLAGANMPAVLSEISFVSNANDETLLLEPGQRQRIADGLYRGIAAYLDGLQGIPQNRQKLVTENRVNVLAGFERVAAQGGRNPL